MREEDRYIYINLKKEKLLNENIRWNKKDKFLLNFKFLHTFDVVEKGSWG